MLLKYPNPCALTQSDKTATSPYNTVSASQSRQPVASGATQHVNAAANGANILKATFRVTIVQV